MQVIGRCIQPKRLDSAGSKPSLVAAAGRPDLRFRHMTGSLSSIQVRWFLSVSSTTRDCTVEHQHIRVSELSANRQSLIFKGKKSNLGSNVWSCLVLCPRVSSVLLAPLLGKRELVYVLLVRFLFILHVLHFILFLFLFVLGVGCGSIKQSLLFSNFRCCISK